jgi:uncharacterized protein (TIGR02001 family)
MFNMRTNLTLVVALTLATSTFSNLAHAEIEPATEAKPDNEISLNAAVVSDYRYRGISQTRLKPALQGGADYTNNPTGLYAGTWLSNIKWINDVGGDDNAEWDVYAGKRGEIIREISYDIGGLGYVYPSNGLRPNANTLELYGQVSYGPVYLKYSQSTSNLFGVANSKNSGYLDIGGNFDISHGLTLNLHAGHQNVKNNGNLSYSDYKVGVTKDFGIVSLTLAAVYADTDAYIGPGGEAKNLAKTGLVVAVSKTF